MLKRVLVILLGYLLFTSFFVETWKLETDSMSPGYPAGSRFFVRPYLIRTRGGTLKFPPSRGDFIIFRPPYMEMQPWYLRILDSLLRLVTFQTLMLGSFSREEWENNLMLKRVIAVPGDTIRIEKSVAYIKGMGEDFFVSEFEVSKKAYDLVLEVLPRGWTLDMQLFGDMNSVVLGEDEYFILGDNRAGSNDSRYWGTVTSDNLYGQVLFSYWPPSSFGKIR
ncbi:signal peptidase I [Olavius algarvensis spirochete endosymbiont]|uniref:signal peptidase I n=1 Tax=Olavius algarvensis spirochete endosymbiont TaxID=260710 RepID=UPI0018A84E24|nr:signal peptidase I [Olavius algarvensis spirochete endosymbiont]